VAAGGPADTACAVSAAALDRVDDPTEIPERRAVPEAVWAPYALALLLFAVYATLSVARFERMATLSWDLAIFEQAVRGYASLGAPIIDVKGPGFSQLGDHFSPLIAVFAPAYALFPTPVTLLLAQAALFACSAIPVSRVAVRFLGLARGMGIGVAYGISWGVQRAVDFDFHEICLAVPLLAFALERLLRGQWWAAAAWTVPLVLVKEDLGLTVAAVGAYLVLRRQRKLGIWLALFGLGSFALTVLVLMPAANPGGTYEHWGNVDGAAGSEAGTLALRLLAWPVHAVSPPTKLWTLALLLGITGFLALRSPLVLLAIPTLTWRFLSDQPAYWGTSWHYSAILMPIVFVAMVDALVRVEGSRRRWLRSYARMAVPAAVAIGLALCWRLPVSDLADPDTYRPSPRTDAAAGALALIPDGSTVEANVAPMTALASRTRVFWLGRTGDLRPAFIAVNLRSGWSRQPPQDRQDLLAYAGRLHPGATYDVVYDVEGYAVLKLRPSRARRG
jgi:uncharacterized membrane protein